MADTAQEKTKGKEQQAVQEEIGRKFEPFVGPRAEGSKAGGESDLNKRQKCAVRVGQPPQKLSQAIFWVEIKTDLEAVQSFERDAQRQEKEQSPPADAVMAQRDAASIFRVRVIHECSSPGRTASPISGAGPRRPADPAR